MIVCGDCEPRGDLGSFAQSSIYVEAYRVFNLHVKFVPTITPHVPRMFTLYVIYKFYGQLQSPISVVAVLCTA